MRSSSWGSAAAGGRGASGGGGGGIGIAPAPGGRDIDSASDTPSSASACHAAAAHGATDGGTGPSPLVVLCCGGGDAARHDAGACGAAGSAARNPAWWPLTRRSTAPAAPGGHPRRGDSPSAGSAGGSSPFTSMSDFFATGTTGGGGGGGDNPAAGSTGARGLPRLAGGVDNTSRNQEAPPQRTSLLRRLFTGGRGKTASGGGGSGAGATGPGATAGASSTGRRRLLSLKPKVEPKTYFANERTMLQWLQSALNNATFATLHFVGPPPVCLISSFSTEQTAATTQTDSCRRCCVSSRPPAVGTLLLFTGLTLLSFSVKSDDSADVVGSGSGTHAPSAATGDGGHLLPLTAERTQRFAGMIMGPFAIVIMAYALGMYLWRNRQISRRDPAARYDECVGPTLLVIVLLFVASACVGIALSRWALPTQADFAGGGSGGGAAAAAHNKTSKHLRESAAAAAPSVTELALSSATAFAADGSAQRQQQAVDWWPQPPQASEVSQPTAPGPTSADNSGVPSAAAAAPDGLSASRGAEAAAALVPDVRLLQPSEQLSVVPLALTPQQPSDPSGSAASGTALNAAGGAVGSPGVRTSAAAGQFRPPPPPACSAPVPGLTFGPFALPSGMVRGVRLILLPFSCIVCRCISAPSSVFVNVLRCFNTKSSLRRRSFRPERSLPAAPSRSSLPRPRTSTTPLPAPPPATPAQHRLSRRLAGRQRRLPTSSRGASPLPVLAASLSWRVPSADRLLEDSRL